MILYFFNEKLIIFMINLLTLKGLIKLQMKHFEQIAFFLTLFFDIIIYDKFIIL